jgi:hypothetical protein
MADNDSKLCAGMEFEPVCPEPLLIENILLKLIFKVR